MGNSTKTRTLNDLWPGTTTLPTVPEERSLLVAAVTESSPVAALTESLLSSLVNNSSTGRRSREVCTFDGQAVIAVNCGRSSAITEDERKSKIS